VATTGCEKQRMTCLLGMDALNNILPSFIVLKGKTVPQDLQGIQGTNLFLSSNDNAWISEELFLKWITWICKPRTHEFKRSLLIMDQFRVHKMTSVLKELEDCQTDVLFIPAGMTFYLQPCDVYLNKPLKEYVKGAWQAFMLAQKEVVEGNFILLVFY